MNEGGQQTPFSSGQKAEKNKMPTDTIFSSTTVAGNTSKKTQSDHCFCTPRLTCSGVYALLEMSGIGFVGELMMLGRTE